VIISQYLDNGDGALFQIICAIVVHSGSESTEWVDNERDCIVVYVIEEPSLLVSRLQ
jgi:hypothetical protein